MRIDPPSATIHELTTPGSITSVSRDFWTQMCSLPAAVSHSWASHIHHSERSPAGSWRPSSMRAHCVCLSTSCASSETSRISGYLPNVPRGSDKISQIRKCSCLAITIDVSWLTLESTAIQRWICRKRTCSSYSQSHAMDMISVMESGPSQKTSSNQCGGCTELAGRYDLRHSRSVFRATRGWSAWIPV
jgi:hypothetical protein